MWADGEKRSYENGDAVDLPYSIQLRDRGVPAPPLSLPPDHFLCILVREDAGLAHQALVFQFMACYFLVDGFQA